MIHIRIYTPYRLAMWLYTLYNIQSSLYYMYSLCIFFFVIRLLYVSAYTPNIIWKCVENMVGIFWNKCT